MRSVLDHTPVLPSARRDVSGENSFWGDPGSRDGADVYWCLVRPRLSKLLEFLHLDVVFDRASGAYLRPGTAEPMLDLIGGYGTLLFGHNQPELTRTAVAYLNGRSTRVWQEPAAMEGGMPRAEHRRSARPRPLGRLWAIPLLIALAATGCSPRLWAVNRLGDALAGAGSGWAGDEDPELVRDATPFALKTIESLLGESPRHRGLLLAAASGFTQYTYAFVQQEANELEANDPGQGEVLRRRAQGFYRRARDYGLRGLEGDHPGFTARLSRDPNAALSEMRSGDVPFLYWTAGAWGAWIGLSKEKPARLAELPIVEAMMRRALALDPGFNAGALHEFFIAYEGGRPEAMGGSVAKAREHFAEAVALSAGRRASPLVALAETVAVRLQDREEFDRLLDAALALDIERAPE